MAPDMKVTKRVLRFTYISCPVTTKEPDQPSISLSDSWKEGFEVGYELHNARSPLSRLQAKAAQERAAVLIEGSNPVLLILRASLFNDNG